MRLTRMLAVADTMPSHTGFASPLLPVDEHGDYVLVLLNSEAFVGARDGSWLVATLLVTGSVEAVPQIRDVGAVRREEGKKEYPRTA